MAFLSICEGVLIYVGCGGILAVWNIRTMDVLFKGVSVVSLISHNIIAVDVVEGKLHAKSASKIFVYDEGLGCWASVARVSNPGRVLRVDELELQLDSAIRRESADVMHYLKLYAHLLVDTDSVSKARELVSELW